MSLLRPRETARELQTGSLAAYAGYPAAFVLGSPELLAESPSEEHLAGARWSSVATGLRSVRRGVLVTLAVCAAIVFAQAAPDNPLPPPRMSAAAIALAIATIFFRSLANSPVMKPKRRVFLALGSLLCSAAIGLLGVAAAWTGGARQIGLGFILGATILVLRPPVPPLAVGLEHLRMTESVSALSVRLAATLIGAAAGEVV